eukprot:285457-Rhodomonas_salina.3
MSHPNTGAIVQGAEEPPYMVRPYLLAPYAASIPDITQHMHAYPCCCWPDAGHADARFASSARIPLFRGRPDDAQQLHALHGRLPQRSLIAKRSQPPAFQRQVALARR